MIDSFKEQEWTAYVITGPSPVVVGEERSYTVYLQDGPEPDPPESSYPITIGYEWYSSDESILQHVSGSTFKGISEGTTNVNYRKYYFTTDFYNRVTVFENSKLVKVIKKDEGEDSYPIIVQYDNGMVVDREYIWGINTLPTSLAIFSNTETNLINFDGITKEVTTLDTGSESTTISKDDDFSFPINYTIVSSEEPYIGLSNVPLTMPINSSHKLSTNKLGGAAFFDYIYSSDDEDIIKINSQTGYINAVGIGTAEITVFDKVSRVETSVNIQVVSENDNYIDMTYDSLINKDNNFFVVYPNTVGDVEDTDYDVTSSNEDVINIVDGGDLYYLVTENNDLGTVEITITGNNSDISRSFTVSSFEDEPCVINVKGKRTFEAKTESILEANTFGFPESVDYPEAEEYIWETENVWVELENELGVVSNKITGKTCKVRTTLCDKLGTITVTGKKSLGTYTFNVMSVGHPFSYIEVIAPSSMKECNVYTDIYTTIIDNATTQDNLDWDLDYFDDSSETYKPYSGEVWENKLYPGNIGIDPVDVRISVSGKETCVNSRGKSTLITVYSALKYRKNCACSGQQAKMTINTINNDGLMNIFGPNVLLQKESSSFSLVKSGDVNLKDIGWFSPDSVEFSNPLSETTDITANSLGVQRIAVSARCEDCIDETSPPMIVSSFFVDCKKEQERFIILSGQQTVYCGENNIEVDIIKNNLQDDETGFFVSESIISAKDCDATIVGDKIIINNLNPFSTSYIEVKYSFTRENVVENEPPNPPITQEVTYESTYRANIAGIGVSIEGSNYIEKGNTKTYSAILYGFGDEVPDSYSWFINNTRAEISGSTTSPTVNILANSIDGYFGFVYLTLVVIKNGKLYSSNLYIYIGRLAEPYEKMLINTPTGYVLTCLEQAQWNEVIAINRVETFDEIIEFQYSDPESVIVQKDNSSVHILPINTGVHTITATSKPSGRSLTWNVYVFNLLGSCNDAPDGMNPFRYDDAPLRIYETFYRSAYMLGECQTLTTKELGLDCNLEWDSNFKEGQIPRVVREDGPLWWGRDALLITMTMPPNILKQDEEQEQEYKAELQFKGIPNSLWRGTHIGPIKSSPLEVVFGGYEVTKPSNIRPSESGCGGACDEGLTCDDDPWKLQEDLESFVYNCNCCIEMMGQPPRLPRIMPDDDWDDIKPKFEQWVAYYNNLCESDCIGWYPECDPPESGSCPGLICPFTYTWTENFNMQLFNDFREAIDSLCCRNVCGTCATRYTLTISGLETCPSPPRDDILILCGDPICYPGGSQPEAYPSVESWGNVYTYIPQPNGYDYVYASPLPDGSHLNDVYDLYLSGGCGFREQDGKCDDTATNLAKDTVWGMRRNTCPSELYCYSIDYVEVPPGSGNWECLNGCEDSHPQHEIEGYIYTGDGRHTIGVLLSFTVGSTIRVSIRWNNGWGDIGYIFDAEIELEETEAGVYVLNSPKTASNKNSEEWGSLPKELCANVSSIDWAKRLGLNGTMTVAPVE